MEMSQSFIVFALLERGGAPRAERLKELLCLPAEKQGLEGKQSSVSCLLVQRQEEIASPQESLIPGLLNIQIVERP